ncbi:hypothetical protein OROGR_019136 [Orobanche gracilis]
MKEGVHLPDHIWAQIGKRSSIRDQMRMRAVCKGWKDCLGTEEALAWAKRVEEANRVCYDLLRFMWPGDTLDYAMQVYRVVPRICTQCKYFLNVFQPRWEVEGIKQGWTYRKVELYLRGEFHPEE